LIDRLEYREALEHALHCPEALTSRRAAWLLGQLGDERAVPALISALDFGDPYVAAEAVTALACLGGPQAWRAVRAAAGHDFATVRKAAGDALRRGGTAP